LTFRSTGPGEIHLVGSAAGPLGGDHLRLDIALADRSSLRVRSVAATMVYPGRVSGDSHSDIHVDIDAQSSLTWAPEPTVLVRGCVHRQSVTINLSSGSHLVWRDEFVLGRWGEVSGSVSQQLRIVRDGRALVHNGLRLGPRWPHADGPAVLANARVVSTTVLVGQPACTENLGDEMFDDVLWQRFVLDDDAVMVQAVGSNLERVRQATSVRLGVEGTH
jgi:urease accessory protein